MPDLERWLTEIEGRHWKTDRVWNPGETYKACVRCGQQWPCDTITLARVVRAQAKALDFYGDVRMYKIHDYSTGCAVEMDGGDTVHKTLQRIAAIIGGEEASGE